MTDAERRARDERRYLDANDFCLDSRNCSLKTSSIIRSPLRAVAGSSSTVVGRSFPPRAGSLDRGRFHAVHPRLDRRLVRLNRPVLRFRQERDPGALLPRPGDDFSAVPEKVLHAPGLAEPPVPVRDQVLGLAPGAPHDDDAVVVRLAAEPLRLARI